MQFDYIYNIVILWLSFIFQDFISYITLWLCRFAKFLTVPQGAFVREGSTEFNSSAMYMYTSEYSSIFGKHLRISCIKPWYNVNIVHYQSTLLLYFPIIYCNQRDPARSHDMTTFPSTGHKYLCDIDENGKERYPFKVSDNTATI